MLDDLFWLVKNHPFFVGEFIWFPRNHHSRWLKIASFCWNRNVRGMQLAIRKEAAQIFLSGSYLKVPATART
jgi:hypothetical protein